MQYPIPQFVEKESNIIYFLTFRQFFWLVGGGAVVVMLYFLLPFNFFIIAALLVMLLIAAIAFIKIDNVSILTIFFHFVGYTAGSKNYVWKKKETAYPFKEQEKQALEKFSAQTSVQSKPLVPMSKTSKLQGAKKMVETSKR